MVFRRLVALGLALCLPVAGCAPSSPGTAPSPASGRHRVQASGTAAEALLASGATLVADYGTFRVLDASPPALQASAAAGRVELRNDFFRIALNSGDLDTSRAAPRALGAPAVGPDGKALHLLQFAGPIRPEWLARLAATGVRVVAHVPANAYLVYGDAPALLRLRAFSSAASEVQYEDAYLPAQKLDRALPSSGQGSYAVQLVEDPAVNAGTLALAERLARRPGTVSRALGYVNLVVHADRAAAESLAARPDVVSVQPWAEPRLLGERQDVIVSGQLTGGLPNGPGYLAWLAAKGFTQAQFDASAFGVDVSDSGIDNGTILPNHFGLYRAGDVAGASRVGYARLEGTPHAGSTIEGCDGHGTVNAHIVAGFSDRTGSPFADPQGFRYGLGVAPFVRVGSSVVFDPSSFTSPVYEDLMSRAWADGMRISSNSWGASLPSYTSDCQRYDALVRDAAPAGSALPLAGNQEMTIVFAAGNSGPSAGTIGSPGGAKNVLSAGASENVQPFAGMDRCGITDVSADQALDVVSFSSRGPAADGRTRPDLLAPGTHVSGGVAQAPGQRAEPPAVAAGQANACFGGGGVCGGVGSLYFPAGQQWYTASSGTSHSTPAIAGAAALVRQWFLNQGLPAPSPAMTKAFLVSSTRYMTGAGANDDLFSNAQGMGLLDLGAAFDGTPRLLRDQEAADLFTATGQTRTFTGAVGDASKPFRVTLAWTDAPGSTFGSAWNNDLDLTVEVGGQVYKGNVFSGGTSVAGGSGDFRNNVESVFLPPGATGPFTVTVTAANVTSDGVPGNGTALDQDFALVASNSCGDAAPPAPLDVAAAATAPNEITVSWTPNGAASYRVYRAPATGGPWAPVATLAAPPYVDAGRSGGLTFFYVVRAQQGCAFSAASAEASATATGPCLLPPVFAGAAGAATSGDLVCGNVVSWSAAAPSCGGTLAYDVFRSTAAGFVPGPANRVATGLTGTTFADSGDLVGGTAYRYVVRAVETSAAGAVADANVAERTATPQWWMIRDDFDANRPPDAAARWQERATLGGDQLQIVSGCRWQSPSAAYRFGQTSPACGGFYPNSTRNLLVLGGDGTAGPNGIDIPGTSGITLAFRLWYDLESYWDAAYLAYSTSGAAGPFTQVPDSVSPAGPYIVQGGYNGSTLGGVRGWSGTTPAANGSLLPVVVNLDALAGQKAWFAWSISTDSVVAREGLYLDDVMVGTTCSTTATPGPAVRYLITGLPSQIAADVPATLTITAVDAWGRPVTGYGGTAALSATDPAAVLPAGAAFTAGVASVTVRFRTAGARSLAAADGSIQGSAFTTVLPGPDAELRFTGQPPTMTAAPYYTYIGVAVMDAFGNRTSSTATVTLSLGANPGGDALQGTTSAAASNGLATFGVYLRRAAAGYTLIATAAGLTSAESAPFAVVAGQPSTLAFTQQPTAAVAGEILSPAPVVEVRDAYGNVPTASGLVVWISLSYGPPGALLSGTLARSTVNGVVAFDDLSVNRSGPAMYALVASSGILSSGTGTPFPAVAGPAHRVVFVDQPGSGRAGVPLIPSPTALLLDRFGNPALAATTPVSLSFASNPTLARLLGVTTALPSNGFVTFPGVAIDRAGAAFALYAGAPGLLGDTSVGLDVTPGPVARYALSGPTTAAAGVVGAYTASARDALGNEVTDYVGTAIVTSSDPAAGLPPPVSFPGARIGGALVIFRTAGTQTLTFTESSGAAAGSLSVTVTGADTGQGSGGGGGCHCGSAGAGGSLALLALAALLRRGRRRRALPMAGPCGPPPRA